MLKTIKEWILLPNEFSSFEEAKEGIGQWIEVDYVGGGKLMLRGKFYLKLKVFQKLSVLNGNPKSYPLKKI